MNKNWKYCELNDAVERGSSNISLNKIKGEDGEYPVFAARGFVQNVSFYHQKKEYLGIIKDGAGIGRVSKYPAKSSVVATMQYLIPKDGFDIDFIRYFLEGVDFDKHKSGSTIPHIYFKDYKSERFPNIPLPEQQRIVSLLDHCFAAIDQAKTNAEQNLQNAKEVFESYLQGVFEKKGEGWEEKKLKEIGRAQTGTTPRTAIRENYGDYIPFIKPADVDFSGVGDIRYDNGGLSEIGLKRGRKIEANSILMVCIGATIGKVGFVEREVSCNQQINALTVNDEFNPKFIYYAMTSNSFQAKVLLEGKGAQATLPIINKTKWENLTINYPISKLEQSRFVEKFYKLSIKSQQLQSHYQKKIDDLEELKQSILQKAFAGELKTEKMVEELEEIQL